MMIFMIKSLETVVDVVLEGKGGKACENAEQPCEKCLRRRIAFFLREM